MSNNQLILTPEDSDYHPEETATLQQVLEDIGFIAGSFGNPDERRFLTGERFLQLITFMGCSPSIELEPESPDAIDFCHIRMPAPFKNKQLYLSQNSTAPRCPSCRHRFADWKDHVDDWQAVPHQQFVCNNCRESIEPAQLDWRNSAGAGHVFIHIHNIFPGEAVPVPELMDTLKKACDTPWRYFYYHATGADTA